MIFFPPNPIFQLNKREATKDANIYEHMSSEVLMSPLLTFYWAHFAYFVNKTDITSKILYSNMAVTV
jgi:hypothetical protein